METEKTNGKKEKAKCCEFGEVFKDFQAMCETMRAYCSDQKDSKSCAAMMKSFVLT